MSMPVVFCYSRKSVSVWQRGTQRRYRGGGISDRKVMELVPCRFTFSLEADQLGIHSHVTEAMATVMYMTDK